MPDPTYAPSDPRYYTVRRKFGNMGNLIAGKVDPSLDDEEIETAIANVENYRAYVISSLPWKPSKEEVINHVLELVPELGIPQEQRESRRQLSERARQLILNTSLRCAPILNGRPRPNRLDSSFYRRGEEWEVKDVNDKIQERLRISPEERGRMLQEHIDTYYDLYQRVLQHEVSDEELFNNFENLQIMEDLVMNAQNFLKESEPDPVTGEIFATLTDDMRTKLKDMERRSAEIFRFVDRVRIIANPNYEFMDLEALLDLDTEKYDQIADYAFDGDDLVLADATEFMGSARYTKKVGGRDNMMKRIVDDFPDEYEGATLEFVGSNGKVYGMKYSTDHFDTTIELNIHQGCLLVTAPSGKSAYYHLDNTTGRVEETDASDLFAKAPASTVGVLNGLKNANEGFFIGSKEYRKALKDMPRVLNALREVGNPPSLEEMDKATAVLQETLENAQKYIANKKKGQPTQVALAKKSQREIDRFYAMEQVVNYCNLQMNIYAAKRRELEAEMQVDQHVEDHVNENTQSAAENAKVSGQIVEEKENMPVVQEPDQNVLNEENLVDEAPFFADDDDFHANAMDDGEMNVFRKAKKMYGGRPIPPSDAGNIVDELRQNIDQSLERMLEEDTFEPNEAKATFSNMVLLAVVMRTRSWGLDFDGPQKAGDVEKEFAKRPERIVMAMREVPYIQALTENLNVETLRQYIETDLAKHLADKWIEHAKIRAEAKNQGKEAQKQSEHEVEKQPDAPKSTM